MESCSQIVIPSKTVVITDNTHYPIILENSNYRYTTYDKLNTIKLNDLELLKGYDITGIHLEFPDNLKHIVLIFGNSYIIFDNYLQEYIKTFPIYLTLCKYYEVYISFIYHDDWFDRNIVFDEVKEYKEVEEYSEEEVTIWDGYDYHKGNIVLGKTMEETGKLIRKITKGAEVTLPEIRFDIAKIKHQNEFIKYPVRQKIILRDNISSEYKDLLFKKYNLNLINNNTGYIDNEIICSYGLMSLYTTF